MKNKTVYDGYIYKFPLMLSERLVPRGTEMPDTSRLMAYECLVFQRYGPEREWRCMACAEAGNEHYCTDESIQGHCDAHQMGLDYALVCLRRNGMLAAGI